MTVHEDVIISHRGARYEIGRGPGCYAIWPAGAGHLQPIEWWPETEAGWQDAWARFTDIESRRSITEVPQTADPGPAGQAAAAGLAATTSAPPPGRTGPRAVLAGSGPRTMIAAGLLTLGVMLGIAGLFPGYFGSSSLTSSATEYVPHLFYLAAWAAAAVLIVLGGTRQRAGALLAAGTSAVTLGLFIADVGTAASGGASQVGAGLILSLIGWAACSAGAVAALVRGGAGAPGRPHGSDAIVHLVLGLAAAIGAAVAFAPSWDRFTLRTPSGVSQSITEGYAFANPGSVIAGDVIVMVALVAVVLVATLWRPVRFGAALLAGAAVPMVAQAISAIVQIRGTVSPLQFGITPSQAARIGLTISAGLTPAFWIFCAFVLGLLLTWSLMLVTPAPAPPAPRARPAYSPAGAAPFDATTPAAG
ncbi:MAG TPA: hypothetical protein VF843_02585 [Streptosporangiaceae bacterium]